MEESVYNVIEVVGFAETSWEHAAKAAVADVDKSVRDMRIAGVVKMVMRLEDNRIAGYRTRVKVSFKREYFTHESPPEITTPHLGIPFQDSPGPKRQRRTVFSRPEPNQMQA